MKTFNKGRKTQKGLFIQMKVIEGTGEIWHSINTTRIKLDLRNLSEILYSLDCRCTRRKRKDIWNRFKFDGGHRIGVDIDTKR